jgi:peroxiredoxin
MQTAKRPSSQRSHPATRRSGRSRAWLVIGSFAIGVVVAGFVYYGGRGAAGGAVSGSAPDFSLPSTDGSTVSLADLRGTNVLLYFNEGAGCDACFYQMQEIERNAAAFASAGVTVVPIVANPLDMTRGEVARFGLSTPYLTDLDTSVSNAYGMIGNGMHANLPGHGFVLIDGAGNLRWRMEYPSMYVSASDLLTSVTDALAQPAN